MAKTGIIGFGSMGSAIAAGLAESCPDMQITVYDRVKEKQSDMTEKHSLIFASSASELVKNSEIIIIAVKPKDADALLSEIAPHSKNRKIISVMAGRTLKSIADLLETDSICRFMPNLAAQYGKSFTAVSFYKTPDQGFESAALEIAGSFGKALIMPESSMPAVTAVSGSGIAFAFQFAHALALGGLRAGIGWNEALRMAVQVLEGAAVTLKLSGRNPADLALSVASPAGTTIEGLAALEAGGFNASVMEAVQAAFEKACDMESSLH